MIRKRFQEKLLAWYRENARKGLPWRKTRDPYAIWISETMLQQTQVAKVVPYYQRFLKRFPTVQALARAPVTVVLDSWAGLGYYSRAKNLHAAAQKILQEYGGRVPRDPEQLLSLPGVGRYTAGAVASIAYDRPAPVLDGNVIRVLSRYFGIREDPREPSVQRRLLALSQELVPARRPGDFNQALMECGALVCTPRQPNCPSCPLREGCRALRMGEQDRIPVRRATPRRKKIAYVCGILKKDGAVLLARRPLSGLLPGLWEFPGGERVGGEPEGAALKRHLLERLGIRANSVEPAGSIRQILSHRELEIEAFFCRWAKISPRLRWYIAARWVPTSNLNQRALTAGMLKLAGTL